MKGSPTRSRQCAGGGKQDRRGDHLDAFCGEDLVEGGCEAVSRAWMNGARESLSCRETTSDDNGAIHQVSLQLRDGTP